GNRVMMGQATLESMVEVPIFADVSRQHATLHRDAEGYFLEGHRKVTVNGKEVERALLQSGDRFTLGSACQFQFLQPVPVSASARLELVSGHRLYRAVDAVLLMAETLVLGPGPQAHVVISDLEKPVVLFRGKSGLALRFGGRLLVNGAPFQERAPVEAG